MNKTVLPMMHGFYSLGTLAGAGVGMMLTAFSIQLRIFFWLQWLLSHLFSSPSKLFLTARAKMPLTVLTPVKKDCLFIVISSHMLIGVVVLAMAFAEGSANDWLPLLMVDGHGFSRHQAR